MPARRRREPAGPVSPPGTLRVIRRRPEIWNRDTDPGGYGENAGRADGERYEEPVVCTHCDPDWDACPECYDSGTCSECGRDLTE